MKPLAPIPDEGLLAAEGIMKQARAQKRQPIVSMGTNTSFPKIAKQHMNYVSQSMAKLYPDLV